MPQATVRWYIRHRGGTADALEAVCYTPLGKQQSRWFEGPEFPGANPGGSILE
jgi:hypothetical protein